MKKAVHLHRTRATRTRVGCGDFTNCASGLPQFCLVSVATERAGTDWDECAEFLRLPHADVGWLLKTRLVRERPYITHAGIEAHTAPLDRYSFPSGHTLHAVCLTLIATTYLPELAIVLVPLALLIAASRVVLGLHYPTDVLAGGALGAVLGTTILAVTSG